MRIVSLDPSITGLLMNLGVVDGLVGVSSQCALSSPPEQVSTGQGQRPAVEPLRLTAPGAAAVAGEFAALQKYLAFEPVDLAKLRQAAPDIIVTRVSEAVGLPEDPKSPGAKAASIQVSELEQLLRTYLNNSTLQLVALRPTRLEEIYLLFERVGKAVGKAAAGHERAQRLKAQLMDWADNFYERTKNKKVTFLASINPLRLGGLWIPDMIALCSSVSQQRLSGSPHNEIKWDDIVSFNPDVIVVAPEGIDLKGSMAAFKELSKLPHWEDLPAVKRSEVIFTDGISHFYNPATGITDSMAILLSAIAGFESGYIAPRDIFYRLRWLELHRHRL